MLYYLSKEKSTCQDIYLAKCDDRRDREREAEHLERPAIEPNWQRRRPWPYWPGCWTFWPPPLRPDDDVDCTFGALVVVGRLPWKGATTMKIHPM